MVSKRVTLIMFCTLHTNTTMKTIQKEVQSNDDLHFFSPNSKSRAHNKNDKRNPVCLILKVSDLSTTSGGPTDGAKFNNAGGKGDSAAVRHLQDDGRSRRVGVTGRRV
ncbi:hypothetical protein EVAR_6367_1 [Eumeta japonica]|uniref:Uncharacterized protein n=1 Tax=Eumeta variegata TaxID=151549 RepID=A0A4C1TFJ7_EUMVA|nr:hypothetical protein EVAR_6367_1 [Eumeta japonica]